MLCRHPRRHPGSTRGIARSQPGAVERGNGGAAIKYLPALVELDCGGGQRRADGRGVGVWVVSPIRTIQDLANADHLEWQSVWLKRLPGWTIGYLLTWMLAFFSVFAETLVALVIGNDNYATLPMLNNAGTVVRSGNSRFCVARKLTR